MIKGSKMTAEQRKRMSDSHKGHKLSETTKQKMKGRIPWNKGKNTLPEVKAKISQTLSGRKMPYVAQANKTRSWSDKTKELRRVVAKRNWSNPEYRVKMLSVNVKGERHPSYIKDRSKIKTFINRRDDALYKEWVSKVKNRDGWKCKINNSDCHGRLEAHHILSWRDNPQTRYVVNNGITLCHAHHPHFTNETAEQVELFKKLLD